MATIKSYSDLKQSKVLSKILSDESADMVFIKGIDYTDKYSTHLCTAKEMKEDFDKHLVGWDKYWKLIPCWSLAALLNILPSGKVLIHDKESCKYKCVCNNTDTAFYDNPVDACYWMILKLHELKVL